MRRNIFSFLFGVGIASCMAAGLVHAQGARLQRFGTTGVETSKNQAERSGTSLGAEAAAREKNSPERTLGNAYTQEIEKNAGAERQRGDARLNEMSPNAAQAPSDWAGEGQRNQAGGGNNAANAYGGPAESSKNDASNKQGERQASEQKRNDAQQERADNRDAQNHRDQGDNRQAEERDKNDSRTADEQNAEENRNTASQPAPDGNAGNEGGPRGEQFRASIRGKRDYATPEEKTKRHSAGLNRAEEKPLRLMRQEHDPRAGDGSGTIDPNQAGKQTGRSPNQQPPSARPIDMRQLDMRKITGQGIGQPDAAQKR